MKLYECSLVIRGGGDLASGIAYRLFKSGFRPLILELPQPRMVRASVSFGTAVYDGSVVVEGVKAVRIDSMPENCEYLDYIPICVDEHGEMLSSLKPHILVDARMLKRHGCSSREAADFVIGIGPGFCAGVDVHVVIETNRGADLGRIYETGMAQADTGVPGIVAGKGKERVLRSESDGIIKHHMSLGDVAKEGQVIASVGSSNIRAPFEGKIRGLISEGLLVKRGEKIGDIDPRIDIDYCKISDKARAIGGGVLEAILSHFEFEISI